MTDLDDKETVLNLRYGTGWDLYRLALGGWNVRIGDDSVRGDTLESALAAAVAFIPLPKIPRRPTRMRPEVCQYGAGWTLRSPIPGSPPLTGRIKTKRLAREAAEAWAHRSDDAAEEWDSKYLATVSNGTEGVDWRWER